MLAIVYVFVVFVCIVCVSVPPMRKSSYADHCEVKHSSINQYCYCACIKMCVIEWFFLLVILRIYGMVST